MRVKTDGHCFEQPTKRQACSVAGIMVSGQEGRCCEQHTIRCHMAEDTGGRGQKTDGTPCQNHVIASRMNEAPLHV